MGTFLGKSDFYWPLMVLAEQWQCSLLSNVLCQCPLCTQFCSYYVPSICGKPTVYERTGPAFSGRFAIPAAIYRGAFRARAGKCPPGVLFGQFWAPPSECPKECFLAFFGPKTPKSTQKALFGALCLVPKIAQKALRGALSGPGPKSTPVNGGRDRNER